MPISDSFINLDNAFPLIFRNCLRLQKMENHLYLMLVEKNIYGIC